MWPVPVQELLSLGFSYSQGEMNVTKVFNFGIAKISATTEITEFREISPKFWTLGSTLKREK